MKTPTLEEVKEYFKDAESVKSLQGTTFKGVNKIHSFMEEIFCTDDNLCSREIWNERKGYATILAYKGNEYKITKEQILEIEQWGNKSDAKKVREWFPECFKKELIVGVWYKAFHSNSSEQWGLINITEIESGKIHWYGFFDEIYIEKDWCHDNNIFKEESPKEVEEALIKEWEKLGGKKGIKFKTPINQFNGVDNGKYNFVKADNCLYSDGCAVFNKGKFAKILPNKKKMTISEIEEKLGFQIEIV